MFHLNHTLYKFNHKFLNLITLLFKFLAQTFSYFLLVFFIDVLKKYVFCKSCEKKLTSNQVNNHGKTDNHTNKF